jgi:hypothetical protein
LPLDEVHDRIRSVLMASRKQEREAVFVAGLRQNAKVALPEPASP